MDKNEIVKAARRLPVESRRLIIEQLRKSIEWDETKDLVIVMDRRCGEMRRGFFGPELQLKFYDFAKNVKLYDND